MKDNFFKTIFGLIYLVLLGLSVLAVFVLPIFIVVSIIVLRTTMPLWFLLTSLILSGFDMMFLILFIFKYNQEKKQ